MGGAPASRRSHPDWRPFGAEWLRARFGLLATHHAQARVGTERFQGNSTGGLAEPAWLCRHAGERLAFRPHCRTALAHGDSAVGDGGCVPAVKRGGLGNRTISFATLN